MVLVISIHNQFDLNKIKINFKGFKSHCYLFSAVNYNEIGEKAIVEFSDGSKDEADFIICGDGIHTSSRKYVIDDRDQLAPVHTGLCVYYGVLTNLPPSFPEETGEFIKILFVRHQFFC